MRAVDLHPFFSRMRPGPSRPAGGVPRGGGASATRRRVVAVICFVVSAWIAFSVYSQMAAGHAADARVQQLRDQNAALQREIDDRQRAIDAAAGDVWLAEEARKRGYVLPGETVFVPVSGATTAPAGGGVDNSQLSPLGPPPTPGTGPSPSASPAATPAPTPAPHASPTPYVVVVPPGH